MGGQATWRPQSAQQQQHQQQQPPHPFVTQQACCLRDTFTCCCGSHVYCSARCMCLMEGSSRLLWPCSWQSCRFCSVRTRLPCLCAFPGILYFVKCSARWIFVCGVLIAPSCDMPQGMPFVSTAVKAQAEAAAAAHAQTLAEKLELAARQVSAELRGIKRPSLTRCRPQSRSG